MLRFSHIRGHSHLIGGTRGQLPPWKNSKHYPRVLKEIGPLRSEPLRGDSARPVEGSQVWPPHTHSRGGWPRVPRRLAIVAAATARGAPTAIIGRAALICRVSKMRKENTTRTKSWPKVTMLFYDTTNGILINPINQTTRPAINKSFYATCTNNALY